MRGAWIEVDLRRIARNVQHLIARSNGRSMMAVVKANAYGHGALPVAQAAMQAGAQCFGVATVTEAEELRHGGILAPILVLSLIRPEELETCLRLNIAVTLADEAALAHAARAAMRAGRTLAVHLKVDTGMGRIGCTPREAAGLAEMIARHPSLRLDGVFSHFAAADSDPDYTQEQMETFGAVLSGLRRRKIEVPWRHIQNSAGILGWNPPDVNLVRAGIAIYGLNPDGVSPPPEGLEPALSVHARVAQVKRVTRGTTVGYGRSFTADRELQIATLGVGYADGYRRGLSNRAQVLIGGLSWKVAGRISMDQTTVAVDPDFPVSAGDEAVLIGRQGERRIGAEEVARQLGTISYEILTGLAPRLPRIYRPKG